MKLALILADFGTVLLIKNLDKDRFRKNLGDLIPAYTEVAKRLGNTSRTIKCFCSKCYKTFFS
jgi:phosphoribosylaminoimidazole-succinocarboxamide synthase